MLRKFFSRNVYNIFLCIGVYYSCLPWAIFLVVLCNIFILVLRILFFLVLHRFLSCHVYALYVIPCDPRTFLYLLPCPVQNYLFPWTRNLFHLSTHSFPSDHKANWFIYFIWPRIILYPPVKFHFICLLITLCKCDLFVCLRLLSHAYHNIHVRAKLFIFSIRPIFLFFCALTLLVRALVFCVFFWLPRACSYAITYCLPRAVTFICYILLYIRLLEVMFLFVVFWFVSFHVLWLWLSFLSVFIAFTFFLLRFVFSFCLLLVLLSICCLLLCIGWFLGFVVCFSLKYFNVTLLVVCCLLIFVFAFWFVLFVFAFWFLIFVCDLLL